MIQLTDSQEATFWAKVQVRGSCWIWTGPINSEGDGIYYYNSGEYFAYYVAARLLLGTGEGEIMDHTCGNRLCCNPRHFRQIRCSL